MLRFPVGGIPVEIRPSFWLVAILIAPFPLADALRPGLLPYLLVWTLVVGISVLAHEAGHAFSARRFGARVSVRLYAVGGATMWEASEPLGPWQRTGIAAAGSAVGVALGGIALWLGPLLLPAGPGVAHFAVTSFARVNLVWGVLNWIPVRLLDGGHVLSGALEGLFGERGVRVADVVFPVVTLIGVVVAFRSGLVLLGIVAVALLVGEVRYHRPRAAVAADGNEDL